MSFHRAVEWKSTDGVPTLLISVFLIGGWVTGAAGPAAALTVVLFCLSLRTSKIERGPLVF